MTISRRIDPALASVLNRLRELFLTRGRHDRQLAAAEVTSMLASVRTDVMLAHYEPRSIRASDRWMTTRGEAIEQSSALCPLLFVGSSQEQLPREFIVKRLATLATLLTEPGPGEATPTPATAEVAGGMTLSTLIEEHLSHLDGCLSPQGSNAVTATHANA